MSLFQSETGARQRRAPRTSPAELDPMFTRGLTEEQRKAQASILTNDVTVVVGPPGAGKTELLIKSVAAFRARNTIGTHKSCAYAIASTTSVCLALNAMIELTYEACTVLRVLHHHKTIFSRLSKTDIVVVDEAWVIPATTPNPRADASQWDRLWHIIKGATVVFVGDPRQLPPISDSKGPKGKPFQPLPMGFPTTTFRALMQTNQVASKPPQHRVRLVHLTRIMRITASGEKSEALKEALTGMAAGNASSRAAFVDIMEEISLRSTRGSLPEIATVICDTRRARDVGNNRASRLIANKTAAQVWRLIEPTKGPNAWCAREIVEGQRVMITSNKRNVAAKANPLEPFYEYTNGQYGKVISVEGSTALTDEYNGAHGLQCGTKLDDRIAVRQCVVGEDSRVVVQTARGTVSVHPIANDRKKGTLAMPVQSMIESGWSYITAEKAQGSTVKTGCIIAMSNWDRVSFAKFFSGATRSDDPIDKLKIYPKLPPGWLKKVALERTDYTKLLDATMAFFKWYESSTTEAHLLA